MTPAPPNGTVATLLRRVNARGDASALTPHALVASGLRQKQTRSGAIATLTTPQLLLQQIDDAARGAFSSHHHQLPQGQTQIGHEEDPIAPPMAASSLDSQQLVAELYDAHESLGNDVDCLSHVEVVYLSSLQARIVSIVTSRILMTQTQETKGASTTSIYEECEALVTLSVRPTALARELAFSLFYDLGLSVSVRSCLTGRLCCTTDSQLFACFSGMLVKSVAVASSKPSNTSTDADSAWIQRTVDCLSLFVKQSSRAYRVDRLAKLDPSTLTFLLRTALLSPALSQAAAAETLVETVVCAIYARRDTVGSSRRRSPIDTTELKGIYVTDIEHFGGVELLLTTLYSSLSSSVRRILLVLLYDLTVDQPSRSIQQDGEVVGSVHNGLLQSLLDAKIGDLVVETPLTFVSSGATSALVVKLLHSAVENELLEKHVALVWTALRSTLQVDECFGHSASLASAVKTIAKSSQLQTQGTLGELVSSKVHQLILSTRPEDRFKGERWLAELLVFGLSSDASADIDPQDSPLGEGRAHGGDELEDSLCFDEPADVRLHARTALRELSQSSSESTRLSFARTISVFIRRRVKSGAATAAHIQELSPCLSALTASEEDSPAVLMSVLNTLLLLVVSPDAVPHLDACRLRYDFENCDAPRELVGKLVGSTSLAARILSGTASVDQALVCMIPVNFLLHSLHVFESSGRQSGIANGGTAASLGDYSAATALLVSYALNELRTKQVAISKILPFLDAPDLRVAVIIAQAVIAHVKRELGEQRYYECLRALHSAAVDHGDETALANVVAHARAIAQQLQLTP